MISKITSNPVINCIAVAWFAAQLIKFVITAVLDRKIDFIKFVSSGGMPSSHTSLVISLSVMLYRIYGFSSPEFAIAVAFSVIVMYDASGVRRQAGKQAMLLNQIVELMQADNADIMNVKLKEILGHSPIEVFAGCILGIIIGLLMPIW